MGRTRSHTFYQIFILMLALVGATSAWASDLPLAAGSPLAGFTFDDRPLLLPVQRNFQMAMLTAGSELGRSCSRMEAYGWRMNQLEQERVNQIFNNTVDRLRGIGYSIQAEAPPSISHDITLFTADRPDKHFLFMWSAGELGLVMTLCESTAPVPIRSTRTQTLLQHPTEDVVQIPSRSIPLRAVTNFSPVGDWVGDYICAQGYTGATLHINSLKNENFEGIFRFYPTAKNPSMPNGSYTVYGQYDRASQRILINPGKWIQHPPNYYDTVMVGGFDPARQTFSAYFQGISGCTSFEARYQGNSSYATKKILKKKKHKQRIKHKKEPKKVDASIVPVTAAPVSAAPEAKTAAPAETAAPPSAASVSAPAAPMSATVTAAPMIAEPAPAAASVPVAPVPAASPESKPATTVPAVVASPPTPPAMTTTTTTTIATPVVPAAQAVLPTAPAASPTSPSAAPTPASLPADRLAIAPPTPAVSVQPPPAIVSPPAPVGTAAPASAGH